MKISLISSSFEDVSLMTSSTSSELGVKTTDDSHYPLGIAYLHSYLESCGYSVDSLFLNNTFAKDCYETVISALKDNLPDVVGLQILTPNRLSSYKIIDYIHEKYPEILLVIGGIHSTLMYQQLLEKYPFLVVVLGEGEVTFAELVSNVHLGRKYLKNIDGLAFNDNGRVVKTNNRTLIPDLDVLPFPKHDLFFKDGRKYGCLMTSRGCPFSCSFCSLDAISKGKIRYRSINNVVDEVEYLVKTYPTIRSIWIHDDTFFIDNKRVIDFCKEVIKRDIQVEFIASGRIKPLSKEMINYLVAANFTKVMLGLESGNDGILRTARKKITKKDALEAFKLFAHTPIELHAFLIIGLPGETSETVLETAKFMQQLQRIKYTYYPEIAAILTVYPGTEIYEISKRNGLVNDEFWFSEQPTPLFTLENSKEQLFRYKEIYMNYLSMDRFWKSKALRAQIVMLPYIMTYLIRNIWKPGGLSRFFKFFLSIRIYGWLVKPYRHLKMISAKNG